MASIRQRYCRDCTRANPDAPAVWHYLDEWPHDLPAPTAAPAIHDDQSFRRAYGPGAHVGLGFVPETRGGHSEHLKRHRIAERDEVACGKPKRERGVRKPGFRRTIRSIIDHAG